MIKRLATNVLAASPIWGFLRKRALRDNPLTVLCYHTLGPGQGGVDGWTVLSEKDFRAQLTDLKSHYDIISLDDALSRQAATDCPQVVITFDDGDQGLHTHLLPILRETFLPVTIYVATEQFETRQPFWFDRVVNALQGEGQVNVEGLGSWQLSSSPGKSRWAVLGQVLEALKQASPARREKLADQVVAQGQPFSGPTLGPMTKEQLKELADMPGVTIGAHSHGHELLDQIPLEEAKHSMETSRQFLRDWTGQEVRHFAFPNGNHSPELRAAARDLGFASAAILEERVAPRGTDPFALPRISVGRYDSRARVRLRLAGL